jgi:hypothetical protein
VVARRPFAIVTRVHRLGLTLETESRCKGRVAAIGSEVGEVGRVNKLEP